mgnify:CR=1 FL=1
MFIDEVLIIRSRHFELNATPNKNVHDIDGLIGHLESPGKKLGIPTVHSKLIITMSFKYSQ